MYIKKKYSKKDMAVWTLRESIFFVIMATIVTILYEVVGLKWLQLPWTPIALVGTAVAFLISFQNNAAYDRLWEARKIWGGIVNTSRTWTMMIKDMVNNQHAVEPRSQESLAKEKKVLVHRQIAWMSALRYALRQNKPWETFKGAKSNRKWHEMLDLPELNIPLETELSRLLDKSEVEYVMSKKNKANAIQTLQSNHLRELKDGGFIWEFSFLELENVLKEFFSLQGKSERIKNFPYPRQYATLGYDFVNLFNMLLPFAIVPEFWKIGQNLAEVYPGFGEYFIWAAVPVSAVVSWIFNTMQRIGTAGENPFEGSANDVPITTMARGIEIDMREMMDEGAEEIPLPHPPVYDIQM
ncbi:bestrophin family protein [Roseivirga sp.]|uniref:bestrophin family protein n=1 Tax=Roseivirga sp. TaxID=1964215 RepID=UPI003B8ABA73